MFDRLIDLLVQSVQLFQFFDVVDEYERGVILRLGKFHRTVEPGFVWLIPFAVDRLMVDNVVPRTANLGEQTITTKDGKSVTVRGVVTAKISDVKKAMLEVEHMDDALRDSCSGEIGRVISETTWDDVWHGKADLTGACRKRGWKYGIEIMSVQLADAAPTKCIRLWTE